MIEGRSKVIIPHRKEDGQLMKIIDTHAHYDDTAFDEDRDRLLSTALVSEGVEAVVNMGASMEGAQQSADLADRFPSVYAGCGIHPDEVGLFEKDPSALDRLKTLLMRPKVVCLGEIGLDYHWMVQEKQIQRKWFAVQLRLAAERNLPINVHSREAAQDTMDTILEYGTDRGRAPAGGIIHCYSGSLPMALDYVEMGFCIGIGGVITFKNAKRLRQVVEAIPIEALVTETDCPYMTPEPFRGSRNDSGKIRFVIEKIAQIKGMDPEECSRILRRNAIRVYRLPIEETR